MSLNKRKIETEMGNFWFWFGNFKTSQKTA